MAFIDFPAAAFCSWRYCAIRVRDTCKRLREIFLFKDLTNLGDVEGSGNWKLYFSASFSPHIKTPDHLHIRSTTVNCSTSLANLTNRNRIPHSHTTAGLTPEAGLPLRLPDQECVPFSPVPIRIPGVSAVVAAAAAQQAAPPPPAAPHVVLDARALPDAGERVLGRNGD